jgi:hypothetical protein
VGWAIRCSIHDRAKILFCKTFKSSLGPTASYLIGTGARSVGVKRPGRAEGHSPLELSLIMREIISPCVISCSSHGVNKIFALFGSYAA